MVALVVIEMDDRVGSEISQLEYSITLDSPCDVTLKMDIQILGIFLLVLFFLSYLILGLLGFRKH